MNQAEQNLNPKKVEECDFFKALFSKERVNPCFLQLLVLS